MNGHLENFDKKFLTNSIMLTSTFINGYNAAGEIESEKQRRHL